MPSCPKGQKKSMKIITNASFHDFPPFVTTCTDNNITHNFYFVNVI